MKTFKCVLIEPHYHFIEVIAANQEDAEDEALREFNAKHPEVRDVEVYYTTEEKK